MRNLTATICLTITVLLGSAGVSWSADFQKGLAAAQRGDFATALREWTPLAEQGGADAQFNLGFMYNNGRGVPQDDKTAVKWYRLAAEREQTIQDVGLFLVNFPSYRLPNRLADVLSQWLEKPPTGNSRIPIGAIRKPNSLTISH